MEGWITLNRKILDWEWYDDSKMVHLFIHLLLRANHEDARWHGKVVERGSFITSLDKLSEETSLSVKSVRTCLQKLEKTGEICMQTANKYRVITICKYDSYQDDTNNKGKQTASESQSNGKQRATNNNDNNIIESFTNVNNSSEPEKEVKPKKASKKKNDVITDENGNIELFSSDEGKKHKQKAKDYVQPTIEEVISYFEAQGKSRESAELFFYHYDGLGWRNVRGTRIVHWDSIANKWMREEEQQSISNQRKNERSTNYRTDDELATEARAERQQRVAELVRRSLEEDSGPVTSDVW